MQLHAHFEPMCYAVHLVAYVPRGPRENARQWDLYMSRLVRIYVNFEGHCKTYPQHWKFGRTIWCDPTSRSRLCGHVPFIDLDFIHHPHWRNVVSVSNDATCINAG